jgi:hypothetical protein
MAGEPAGRKGRGWGEGGATIGPFAALRTARLAGPKGSVYLRAESTLFRCSLGLYIIAIRDVRNRYKSNQIR